MTRRTPDQYNWDKQEFDELIMQKHRTQPRRDKVRFIVAHHMTVHDSDDGAANRKCYAIWQQREASAHYCVDNDYLQQSVWDKDAAWACANTYGNHAGISIEHANSSLGPKWTISTKTWKNGAKLAAYLHRTYKLGRPTNVGFGEAGGTMRTHQSFYSTACPGPWMEANWKKYVAEAQRVYDEITNTTPPTKKTIFKTAYFQAACYNTHGAQTATKRAEAYCRARLAAPDVHVIGMLELGNGIGTKKKPNARMRPKIDAGLKAKYRRADGTDGRYTYPAVGVKVIASGTFTAKSGNWYQKDDKQAAWIVEEIDGIRVQYVVAHLESDLGPEADAKRVKQALDFAHQALVNAPKHGVKEANIQIDWDTNSNNQVIDALDAAGWRNLADGTSHENDPTYIGWNELMKDRYDYSTVRKNARPGKVVGRAANTGLSDHVTSRAELELTP